VPECLVNKLLLYYEESSWIYVASDLGMYGSEDNGANWGITPEFALNSGPVFHEFTDLRWGPKNVTDGRALYASSYGRGIWKTSDDVLADIYIDEDHVGGQNGTLDYPYKTIEQGENNQAHGQTWHIDGGD